MNLKKASLTGILCISSLIASMAQDGAYYTGKTLSNVDYHHGQLSPAVGTHNIQVLRANREHPELSDGLGWTYNHAPMLAYWNGTFYLEYLNAPIGEHMPPGQTMLITSKDGYSWSKPVDLFPKYKVPDGYTKPAYKASPAKDLYAITHHRVGFFTSKKGRLLAMTFYGVCLDMKDDPNDGNGVGRVVREIKKDGSFGDVYFIRYSHAFNEKNTDFKFYKKSKDKGFIEACEELLANPLYMMQWVEEADRNDPIIPLNKPYKAFSYYTLQDGRVVGLWKHALTAISNDGGHTWPENAHRAPGFVNSNAKIWGQQTSDGKYATVYNPSEFRWPLAVSTSEDGLEYTNLYLVHGDITPMRYGGNYKSNGPQYVRGILPNNGTPPDNNMWVTYSMNKEDLWVSRVPVPITDKALSHADETFDKMERGKELDVWNIYSPLDAPAKIEVKDGKRWLALKDWDLFDYAKAERVIPESKTLDASFSVLPMQNDRGNLQIEFQNSKGEACTRIIFDKDGSIRLKTGARYNTLDSYQAGIIYNFTVLLSTATRSLTMQINNKKIPMRLFFNPVESITRVVFRTGDLPSEPTPNTPADRFTDLPDASGSEPKAEYYISHLKTANTASSSAILNVDDYKHYADYFNAMEDENIVQAIPNSESWNWMKANIPLFDCPQKNFEEMYYFRWWSLRKHIKETPTGYAMTEFLVNRSYADKYNLISCALGHHTYESRWLRDSKYLDQYIHVWYRGNDGKPMDKIRNFSSWTADALYNKYLVDGNKSYLLDMFSDLESEYSLWEGDHRLPSGLYWQGDVQDGMEETISGGRRKKYARPTINSYMYANAKALAAIARLGNDATSEKRYEDKAAEIKNLVQAQLWNNDSIFFETLRKPGEFALVREAIGYIPWYFNLPDDKVTYAKAWEQVKDEKGFLAPYGLTTAERRHPLFRTHGCCKCEWDGAIWPFASSQTLTAMANLLNNYKQNIVNDSVYFAHMNLYVESQYHRGRPYIGEYQDEVTGYWLKGDQERSRYYNHSTFNDLIITGLVGLRPRADDVLDINPLIPQDKWDWFCLDNIPYHGRNITIVWDKTGDRYRRLKGFYILVDGKLVAKSDRLQRLTYKMD